MMTSKAKPIAERTKSDLNRLSGMNPREQLLLRSVVGDTVPRLCVRSRTRIDTGRWGRRSSVWVCVAADQLAMLAVGRRRYAEHVAIADCRESHYCHATGELTIEPVEGLRLKRLKMSPRQALQVLTEMNPKNENLKPNAEN